MPEEPKQPIKPCQNCDARGKVDNLMHKSWQRISRLPNNHPTKKRVMAGVISPVLCPECDGTGWEKSEPEPASDDPLMDPTGKAVEALLAQPAQPQESDAFTEV